MELLNWLFTGNFITKIAKKQMGKGMALGIQILAHSILAMCPLTNYCPSISSKNGIMHILEN